MTSPAEYAFRRDRSLSSSERRVYDYLSTVLDYKEERNVKSQIQHEECGVGRRQFLAALDTLVARGYLIEHARAERGIRRFTLAHSINPERRTG